MIRPLVLLALVFTALVALTGASGPVSGHAGGAVHTLTLVVEPRPGTQVELQFLVRADDAEQAYGAAASAVRSLMPGAPIVEDAPGTVSAQFAPWGWKWDDSEMPVGVAYNPAGAPEGFGTDAVAAALQTWSAVPGSRFSFNLVGLTDGPPSLQTGESDGLNVIAWVSLDCSQGCVLGLTSKGLGHEADIALNRNPEAHIGDGRNGTLDARSVLLHEAGHLAGLEHSCPALVGPCTDAERNAVMYYRYQGAKRLLESDDIAGLQSLYPAAGALLSPPTEVVGQRAPAPSLPAVPVALRAGWNLTVLPAGPIDAVVGALPCVQAVYSLTVNGWEAWIPGAHPALQGLTAVQPGQAYWVLAGGSCSHEFR